MNVKTQAPEICRARNVYNIAVCFRAGAYQFSVHKIIAKIGTRQTPWGKTDQVNGTRKHSLGRHEGEKEKIISTHKRKEEKGMRFPRAACIRLGSLEGAGHKTKSKNKRLACALTGWWQNPMRGRTLQKIRLELLDTWSSKKSKKFKSTLEMESEHFYSESIKPDNLPGPVRGVRVSHSAPLA